MKNATTASHDVWLGVWMLAFMGACIWSWVKAITEHKLFYIVLCPLSILFFAGAAAFCFWSAHSKLPKKDGAG